MAGPSGSTAKAGAKAGKAGAGLDGRAAASSSASSSTAARTGAAGQDTDAVRALVGQYLAHQGFGSTLAALQRNSAPASPSASASTLKTSLAQAPVILDRRVRHLIVGGDLDGALALLDERYPRVAASAAGFRLKCARLVRMVIDASRAEAAATSSSAAVVVVPTSSAPLSKKRKASAAADGEHGLPPGKAFRSSAQPGASPSTSPPVQLGLPLLPPLAAAPTATAAATAEADEDATDKILAYARSLSALCAARPSPVGTVKAKALADADDLLGACLGLLAFPSLGSPAGGMPDKAVVGEAGAAAFRLQTAAGLEEIADRIDDRLLGPSRPLPLSLLLSRLSADPFPPPPSSPINEQTQSTPRASPTWPPSSATRPPSTARWPTPASARARSSTSAPTSACALRGRHERALLAGSSRTRDPCPRLPFFFFTGLARPSAPHSHTPDTLARPACTPRPSVRSATTPPLFLPACP